MLRHLLKRPARTYTIPELIADLGMAQSTVKQSMDKLADRGWFGTYTPARVHYMPARRYKFTDLGKQQARAWVRKFNFDD